jgi:hypothetical protein
MPMQFSNAEGETYLMSTEFVFIIYVKESRWLPKYDTNREQLDNNKENISVKYQYSITRCVKILFQRLASLEKWLSCRGSQINFSLSRSLLRFC